LRNLFVEKLKIRHFQFSLWISNFLQDLNSWLDYVSFETSSCFSKTSPEITFWKKMKYQIFSIFPLNFPFSFRIWTRDSITFHWRSHHVFRRKIKLFTLVGESLFRKINNPNFSIFSLNVPMSFRISIYDSITFLLRPHHVFRKKFELFTLVRKSLFGKN